MFLEVEIEKIITSSAIINPSSWGLMEKLGFQKVDKTIMIKYTFVEEEIENQVYELDKNTVKDRINDVIKLLKMENFSILMIENKIINSTTRKIIYSHGCPLPHMTA